MFNDVRKYGFINAKLKAKLSKMLKPEFYTRLSRSRTLPEAMVLLKDTEYSEAERTYSETGDLKMAEFALQKEEIRLFTGLRPYLEGEVRDYLDSLLLRYETEILKQALRLWFDRVLRGRDISLESGYMHREPVLRQLPLDDIIAARNYDELLAVLPAGAYTECASDARESVERLKSLFPLEIKLDLHFYSALQQAGEQLVKKDREIVRRMIGVEIDMENITRIMRFHYFYKFTREQISEYLLPGGLNIKRPVLSAAAASPGDAFEHISSSGYPALSALGTMSGETGNPFSRMQLINSLLHEILDKEISKLLGGDPFTIGILLSYFILKRQEIRRLSAVLNGIHYKLSEERMRRLL